MVPTLQKKVAHSALLISFAVAVSLRYTLVLHYITCSSAHYYCYAMYVGAKVTTGFQTYREIYAMSAYFTPVLLYQQIFHQKTAKHTCIVQWSSKSD